MKLLIIEDNRDIAANIADFLEPAGHNLDFAYDGLHGLEQALGNRFDALVIDIGLPGLDGLELCSRLRQAGIDSPVLMLTARDQLDDKLAGFASGADDYLVKPFSVRELEARLQALEKRSSGHRSHPLLKVGSLSYNPDTLEASRDGHRLELNPVQRRLLELLMRNSHRVVSREEMEQHIWGDHQPERDSLRTHIYSLRAVIDKPFDEKLLTTVHGSGYRLTTSTRDAHENYTT